MDTQSQKWSLNDADVQKWFNNVLTFLAPVALIYLAFVADGLKGGFTWLAFQPNQAVTGMMVLYVVNSFMDLFKKLKAGQ